MYVWRKSSLSEQGECNPVMTAAEKQVARDCTVGPLRRKFVKTPLAVKMSSAMGK